MYRNDKTCQESVLMANSVGASTFSGVTALFFTKQR